MNKENQIKDIEEIFGTKPENPMTRKQHGIHYRSGGTKMHTCKNNPKCNPFHKNNN